MVSCTIDEAVRRLLSVGADFDHIGGVDNFCWPNIQYHPCDNPDGMQKAAQLVRACKALKDMCLAYEIPLLSGKDSMYVDGYLSGRYGEKHKVSALETMQFSTIGVIDDVLKCVSMDLKMPGDLIYIIGNTKNELGGSEYYEHFGYIGLNVPKVDAEKFGVMYRALSRAVKEELIASIHGIYRGGLGVHLAMTAMAANLGMHVYLGKIPVKDINRNDGILFSESPGRLIATVSPQNKDRFENILKGLDFALVGIVEEEPILNLRGINGEALISLSVAELRNAWKKTFKDMESGSVRC
jgi:phosphoribosylformylglycinamidine synthase